ncbi:hypothetical protein N8G13_00070 [Mycoplasma zalophi]|uniref:hypothetical protein n=1 Tax=Mycoplasma zalophi TaxID=191287 RepID=UPI0021C5E30F|nr:hypothetical protein [Mycoplasma zalophi]MCU4116865.1 hypothetical protein [Mycoplasma zalophi]
MNISKEQAKNIWNKYFNNENQAQPDFAGRNMHFHLYNDNTSKYGWTVDCLVKEEESTFIPVNILTLNERSGDYTFWANKKLFQVKIKKENKNINYEIICVIDED